MCPASGQLGPWAQRLSSITGDGVVALIDRELKPEVVIAIDVGARAWTGGVAS